MSDQPVNPLINLTSAIFRGVSGAPSRSKTVAPEPIPQTPPPAAVTSRAASTETASASLKSGQGGNLIYHKEHRPVPHNSQDPRAKPRKGLEKQQDSSREESNMEESLLDRDDPIEVDDDYVEVSSDTISREEQRVRPSGRTHLKSSRDKSSSHSAAYRGPPRHPRDKAADITLLYKEQNAKLLEAEGTIREKDKKINALTETITRLHHLREGGTPRDDNYLTAQFSDITNSITAWTVTHFRKSQWQTITDLAELPADLVQLVGNVVHDSTNILGSIKSRRDLINAIVIHTIFLYLFRPFLFGAHEAGNHLLAVWPQLQGTDFQIQRWRALTVNLLAQGPAYEHQCNQDVSSIAVTLAKLLAHLAPIESDAESRDADLLKIVGRAAALSIEIRKQSDLIYLIPVEPGALFKSDFMEDLNCEYELDELEGKAIVQVPIFPAVMRRSCPPGGMLDAPHNLMKARVTTMFVDNE